MNSCMWGAVHLDKDGEQAQRVLRNIVVDLIQKVFTTMLNEVQGFLCSQELSGINSLRAALLPEGRRKSVYLTGALRIRPPASDGSRQGPLPRRA